MRPLIALPLALALITPATAQQSPRSRALNGDPRLDRVVTVHWRKETLYDALTELSKATGVRIAPDRGLADEPIMAAAGKLPARVLLAQIAELEHFRWGTYGGSPGKPNYLLYQSRADQAEEESEIDRAKREVLEALQKELDKYRALGKLPPDELQRRVQAADDDLTRRLAGGIASAGTDPNANRKMVEAMSLHGVASPVGSAMLALLDGLSPAQWNELMGEDAVVFSTDPKQGEVPMPAAIQDRLKSSTPEWVFPGALFKSLGPQVEQAVGAAQGMMRDTWGRASGFKVTVHMSLSMGSQPIGMLQASPAPLGTGRDEIGPLFAMTGLNIMGVPARFDPPTEDAAEREKRLAADPFLSKKAVVKLPELKPQTGFAALLGQAYRLPDVLPPVEEAFGVKLLADAYNRQSMAMIPPFGTAETPLYKVLDALAGQARTWERNGDLIRFRSKTWANDRRAEIPARYMRRWLAIREAKGAFTLDDLADIAKTLRDEQMDSLLYSALDEGVANVTDFLMIPINREMLRFYGKLLPLQRQRLLAGEPLAGEQLFPYQIAALAGLNRGQNQSMFAIGLGARPARKPDQLRQAVVTLQHITQPPQAPPAGFPPGGDGKPNPLGAFVPTSPTVYMLQVALPDGQKDQYSLVVSGKGQEGAPAAPAAPAPAAPPAPVPEQAPPQQ